MLRSQNVKVVLLITFVFILICLVVFMINFFRTSTSEKVVDTVRTFYIYEQEGNYAASWELFHPYMQEKFSKGRYLQDRPHVFMNHFGVDTFTFNIGKVKEEENWVMEEGRDPIDIVYSVPVRQHFSGTYGNFTFSQHVYVTEVDGEWFILWDYTD